MKSKEMPIIEVSKKLKRELDELDIISDAHIFFTRSGVSGLDKELQDIVNEYEGFKYQSQVVMYLVSTKNYVVKPKPTYYVMYGLNSASYYVTKISPVKDKNVYIASYNNEDEAQSHADELNKFVEGK